MTHQDEFLSVPPTEGEALHPPVMGGSLRATSALHSLGVLEALKSPRKFRASMGSLEQELGGAVDRAGSYLNSLAKHNSLVHKTDSRKYPIPNNGISKNEGQKWFTKHQCEVMEDLWGICSLACGPRAAPTCPPS